MSDLAAGQGLYAAHRSALVAYATPILGSREAAEDVVQDAFVRFLPAMARTDTREQALAYLYRIVRNLAFDALKRRRVEARATADDLPFWATPRQGQTPEEAALLCEDISCASGVLAELPAEMRIAVEMHRFGGFTLEEVAEHLGISVATAHRHVRTAMIKVATRLAARRGLPPAV